MTVVILLFSSLVVPASEPAAVNISLPAEGMLLRANVPIFGSVRLPRAAKLKSWRLEYGLGPSPKKWILLTSGTEAIEKDPYEAGEVKWNPNKEPTGNLTNWATGLGSYGYGTWKQNLNGIYTLRLLAETSEGKISEVRKTVFIGEAILRTTGGTAISADLKCRILVPPFAFGGDIGRVVAIIKQVPEESKGLIGVEDARFEAAQIYKTIPANKQLLSPIYRVYPNGFESEPATTLELEAMPGRPGWSDSACLAQYNPETKTWEPMKTTWFGNTASASVDRFASPQAYLAILRSTVPASLTDIQWKPISAIEGAWTGRTLPGAQILVEGAGRKAEGEADASGAFCVPFELGWEPTEYRIRALPVEGGSLAVEKMVPGRPGAMVRPVNPRFSAEVRSDAGDYVLIACEDKGLMGNPTPGLRSMAARIISQDSQTMTWCELQEAIAGSGMFLGRIDASRLVDKKGRVFQQPLTVDLGGQRAVVTLRDTEPPEISLESRTHPNFLYLSAGGTKISPLQTPSMHSRADVRVEDGAWRIAGIGHEPSARVVSWPLEPFPAREWPIIGFTYRLFEQAPWQLQIRSGMELAAYDFNASVSGGGGLRAYARSGPLTADGHWHYWQGNLSEGGFTSITGLAFGSWVKTGYRRVDPGFKGNDSQILEIRDILIGRPSTSPNLELRWTISDRSPIKSILWWVDKEPESNPPSKPEGSLSGIQTAPKKNEQTCQIRLPGDGSWFFHIQATDEAGNVSRTFQYPVFIFGTGAASSMSSEQATAGDPQKLDPLTWKQPEGKVEFPLRGWGNALDVKSLSLIFNGVSFPICNPLWNAASETLTLDVSSFPSGAPLGFDGESITFQISGKDVSGKSMMPLSFEVKIQSIFSWQAENGGGRISSSDQTSRWLAVWEQPTAPWRKFFPGAANNILLLVNVKPARNSYQMVRWRRPVILAGSRTGAVFVRESFKSPGFDVIDSLRTNGAPVFGVSGKLLLPVSSATTGEEWITQLEATDPFETGRMRVTMRRGRQLEQRIVDANELQFLLDNQGQETLRVDAWLSPGEGSLLLDAPGDRRLSFGDESHSEWCKAKVISLSAGKQWRRVAVLIIPQTNYKKTPGARVSGQTCW